MSHCARFNLHVGMSFEKGRALVNSTEDIILELMSMELAGTTLTTQHNISMGSLVQ